MKPLFDVYFANGRTALVIEADLHMGWGKRQKTYGFFKSKRVPYHRDLSIRAQLALIAQPGSHAEWTREFPEVNFEKGDDEIRYLLKDKRLLMTVALSREQPWRTTEQGRPEIFIEELPFLRSAANRWYDLRAWIVFHEAPNTPVPDVHVWAENKLILPSHFESNRRRH